MTSLLVHFCLCLDAMNFFNSNFFTNIWMETKHEVEALKLLQDIEEERELDTTMLEKYWDFVESEKKHSPLIASSKTGNLNTVHLILKIAAEHNNLQPTLHHRTHSGAIALHYAAQSGHLDVVDLLLQSQSPVDFESFKKNTALNLAAEAGHVKIVTSLLKWGADINHINYRRRTPFCMAAEHGQLSVLQILANSGADIHQECEDLEGSQLLKSSVRQAIERGDDTTASFLFELGNQDRSKPGRLLPLEFLCLRHSCFQTLMKGLETSHWQLDERHPDTGHTLLSYAHKLRSQHIVDPLLPSILTKYHKTTIRPSLELFESALHDLEDQRQHVEDFTLLAFIDNLMRDIQARRTRMFLKVWEKGVHLNPRTACVLCDEPREEANIDLGPSECGCWLCKDCEAHFLQFSKKSTEPVKCPGCGELAKSSFFEAAHRFSSEEILSYLKKQYEKISSKNPFWSACPGVDCQLGRIVEPDSDAYYYCPACSFKGCLFCKENHHGPCENTLKEESIQQAFLIRVLKLGKLAPPRKGHPADPNHPDYWKGRVRPCFHCQLPTEREYQPLAEMGFCNSMHCERCGKKWHWNYGDATLHPQNQQRLSDYHDFNAGAQQYRTNP
jgi:ankyrin repeat protein